MIPSSVISIGKSSFEICISLKEIIIPNSVIKIGQSAFESCSSLVEIVLSDSIKEINEYTFYECTSLKEFTLPQNLFEIKPYAFYGCISIEHLAFPLTSPLTTIGRSAFENCKSLTFIGPLSNSITSIGSYAFRGCSDNMYYIITQSNIDFGECPFPKDKKKGINDINNTSTAQNDDSHCEIF